MKSYRKLRQDCYMHKEMHKHYKKLYQVAVEELKYQKTRNEMLWASLSEIENTVEKISPKLIKQIIKNAKERDIISLSIHNQSMCSPYPNFSTLSKKE